MRPRRRRAWIKLTVAVAGAFALVWLLHPAAVPLLNPSTHPWQAKWLFGEIDPSSALGFRRVFGDFLLYHLFVMDPEEQRGLSFVEVHAACLKKREGVLAEARRLATQPDATPELRAACARRILTLGEISEAHDLLEAAVKPTGLSDAPPVLLEALGEASLRLAETRNCVGHHSPESCLYPIQGGGVHTDPAAARRALEVYAELVRRDPDDVAARWLHALVGLALGEPVQGAPEPAGGKAPAPRLTDVATRAGLFNPDAPRSGGGAVLDDLDGDGHLDALIGGYLPGDQLLYYRGRGDGTFEERTEDAGLKGQLGAFRMTQADYDNDGDLDVFVARGGWTTPGRNSLLAGDGRGGFSDVTEQAGLAREIEQSMASAWADVDGDGRLDLFVANLGVTESSRFYFGQADGTFREATAEVGIPPLKLCAGVTFGDVDGDGDADLYVSVAFGHNYLFRNDGGRFTDVTFDAGVARPLTSFPVWFFDVDNDGDLDLFCGTFWPVFGEEVRNLVGGEANPVGILRLYLNRGDGTFDDASEARGLAVNVSTMGANFGDLDSDGLLDVYLGTGSPYVGHLVPNRLFRNTGERFDEATYTAGVGHLQKGHGVAFGDCDGDGDQELLVNLGGAVPVDRFQPALFENPGSGHGWVELTLEGTASNRSAIGARVAATLSDGRTLHRAVASGGPFGCSPLRVHLGLGRAERVARLEVRWPSGRVSAREDLASGQRLRLQEPER